MIPQSRTLRKSSAQPDAMRLDNLDAALLFKPQSAVFYSGDPSKALSSFLLTKVMKIVPKPTKYTKYPKGGKRKKDEPPRVLRKIFFFIKVKIKTSKPPEKTHE